MSNKDLIKKISNMILDGSVNNITSEDIDDLILNSKTEEEENLYIAIYNCILANKQKQVVDNAEF